MAVCVVEQLHVVGRADDEAVLEILHDATFGLFGALAIAQQFADNRLLRLLLLRLLLLLISGLKKKKSKICWFVYLI